MSTNFETAFDATLTDLQAVEEQLEALEQRRAKLRGDMLAMLQAADLGHMVRPAARVSQQAGRGKVEITDMTAIPSAYFRVEVNTSAVLADLRKGKDVPGVELVEGEPTLRVVWAKPEAAEAA